MNKILNYITYQTFPADTANSLQTISNLKYFVKNSYDVYLYFPLREKQSSDDLKILQEKYNFSETINIIGSDHPYPFGKLKRLKKIFYHISHFLWAKKICKNFSTNSKQSEYFLTRSDWVFYFLSKKNLNIIFECHQYSKIRHFVFKRVSHLENTKIVFLNEFIKQEFGLINIKSEIIPSGVDLELFNNLQNITKVENKFIFVGNLLRFDKGRNLEFIFEGFKNLSNFELTIVGGPESESKKLNELVKKQGLTNIAIKGRLNRKDTIQEIMSSSYGLLINSEDKHSRLFTSPLKYFEYIAADLKVIAVDYPSHNILPEQQNIFMFENNNLESFEKSINDASKHDFEHFEIEKYSLDNRVKKILDLYLK